MGGIVSLRGYLLLYLPKHYYLGRYKERLPMFQGNHFLRYSLTLENVGFVQTPKREANSSDGCIESFRFFSADLIFPIFLVT